MIYFDNNATTFMPPSVKQAIIDSMDQGNPSGDYAIAKHSKSIIDSAKEYIANICHISLDDYAVIFNSGASEGNNFLLHSVAETMYTQKPHYILGATEHKTSLECCKELQSRGLISYDAVKPTMDGKTQVGDVMNAINERTMLISVMQANNETGAINDIVELAHQVKRFNPDIILHCDCVQVFGKYPPDLSKLKVDVITLSFHKLYGPQQSGCMIMSKRMARKNKLCPMISGTQNDGMRGGTESAFLIAGCLEAMKLVYTDRLTKNMNLLALKLRLLHNLSVYNIIWYEKQCSLSTDNNVDQCALKIGINIVVYGPSDLSWCLPNTVLMSIIKVTSGDVKAMCNITLKKRLYSKGIVISLGSACNKGAASYVLQEMGVRDVTKLGKSLGQGVIRVSFGDYNTRSEVDKFSDILVNIIDQELLHTS
jgi:cysteine desulfurase